MTEATPHHESNSYPKGWEKIASILLSCGAVDFSSRIPQGKEPATFELIYNPQSGRPLVAFELKDSGRMVRVSLNHSKREVLEVVFKDLKAARDDWSTEPQLTLSNNVT